MDKETKRLFSKIYEDPQLPDEEDPDFKEEMFEFYRAEDMTAEDIGDPEVARQYFHWLEENSVSSDSSQFSTEQAWAQFSGELARSLGNMNEGEFLILTVKRNLFYVQFAGQGSFGLRAEAVSNTYLEGAEKLTSEARAKMLKSGWSAPTNTPDDPKSSPNYFMDIAPPVPYSAVASLAVKSLHDVFGAVHPGDLQYTAFASQSTGGASIRFPNLRIARERD